MYVEACRDQMVQGPPDPRPMVTTQKWKSNAEVAPNCPRCASPNTKFCYYNNYSLSQPRYFCKACRRYWTKGGCLRNVPVGSGCRKLRRPNPGRKTQPPSSTITPTTTTSMGPPPSTSRSDGDDGSVIDLADVFRKFLNQNSVSGDSGTEVLVGSELAEDSKALLEFSSSVSVTTEGGDCHELLSGVPDHRDRKEEQTQIQEYCVGHDPEILGLQTVISTDELVGHGFLWSDFQWQPMIYLQEFRWDETLELQTMTNQY